MDQASKPTYYGFVSYQKHARMKSKEEKPLKLVVSCKSWILSTCDKRNPLRPNYQKQFGMPTTFEHLGKLKWWLAMH